MQGNKAEKQIPSRWAHDRTSPSKTIPRARLGCLCEGVGGLDRNAQTGDLSDAAHQLYHPGEGGATCFSFLLL